MQELVRHLRPCRHLRVAMLRVADALVLALHDSSLELIEQIEVKLRGQRCCQHRALHVRILRSSKCLEATSKSDLVLKTLTSLQRHWSSKFPSDWRELQVFKRHEAISLLLLLQVLVAKFVLLGLLLLNVEPKK